MVINIFDERAREWDSDPMKVERAGVVANALRAAIPFRPGMTALEYGCGTGLLSFALREDLASVTVADTSEGMLAVLSDKIKAARADNMHPLWLDLMTDPLPTARFDLVYSLMVLHHIPDTATILRRFYAVLNPGGWLVVVDLDQEDGSFHTNHAAQVHHGFERPALQALAEAAGFAQVRFSTVYEIKKTSAGGTRTYPLFLMTARKE